MTRYATPAEIPVPSCLPEHMHQIFQLTVWGLSGEEISKRVGKNHSWVRQLQTEMRRKMNAHYNLELKSTLNMVALWWRTGGKMKDG